MFGGYWRGVCVYWEGTWGNVGGGYCSLTLELGAVKRSVMVAGWLVQTQDTAPTVSASLQASPLPQDYVGGGHHNAS